MKLIEKKDTKEDFWRWRSEMINFKYPMNNNILDKYRKTLGNSLFISFFEKEIKKQIDLAHPNAKQIVVLNLICTGTSLNSLDWKMYEGYLKAYLETMKCYLKINREGLVIHETLDNCDDLNSSNWISGQETTTNWITAKKIINKNNKLGNFK